MRDRRRLQGAEVLVGWSVARLSGFLSLLRSRDTAGRTEAFIISELTGYSEEASQAKNEQLPRAAAEATRAILLTSHLFWGVGGVIGVVCNSTGNRQIVMYRAMRTHKVMPLSVQGRKVETGNPKKCLLPRAPLSVAAKRQEKIQINYIVCHEN